MNTPRNSLWLVMALGAITGSSSATADVLSFNFVVNHEGDPYFEHHEPFGSPINFGAIIRATSGEWFGSFVLGNPGGCIYSSSSTASIDLRAGAFAPFTFSSVDLGELDQLNANGPDYLIEGFLDSSPIFSFSGADVPSGFSSVINPNPGLVINRLVITMSREDVTKYAIDNIVAEIVNPVPPVPDPGNTGFLLGSALAFIGLSRLRLLIHAEVS